MIENDMRLFVRLKTSNLESEYRQFCLPFFSSIEQEFFSAPRCSRHLWGVQWTLPTGQCSIKVENSHFDNLTNTIQTSDTWETPLLSLKVFQANSPTYFPSLPLVSFFATCASSSASAPSLCLHHPDPSHLPSSKIPLPISPTIPGGQEVFVPENMALSYFYQLPIYLTLPCIFFNKSSYFFSNFPLSYLVWRRGPQLPKHITSIIFHS